jgi:hypothetical protein
MKHKAGLALLALLFMSPWAWAQTFGPSTLIWEDPQVLNSGSPVFAFDIDDWLSGTTTTVNDVDFSGAAFGSDLTLVNFSGGLLQGAASVSPMTADFGNVLAVAFAGSTGNSVMISLNDLTLDRSYELQLFVGSAGPAGSETVTDGSSSRDLAYGGAGSGADYIVESFVAHNQNEFITITSDTGGNVILNAIDLREDPTAVPEPRALAMLAVGGLLMLGWARRFRPVLAR